MFQNIDSIGVSNDTLVSSDMLKNYIHLDENTGIASLKASISPKVSDQEAVVPIPNGILKNLIRQSPVSQSPTVGEIILEAVRSDVSAASARDNYAKLSLEFTESLRIIAEVAHEHAERHNYCSEYDEIIASINSRLPSDRKLPLREKDFDLNVEYTVTIKMASSVSVTANNFEDAEEQLRENFDDYVDVIEQIRQNPWIIDVEDVSIGDIEED